MEIASLVLSAISTLAAVISAIAAIGAEIEHLSTPVDFKKLKNSINGNGNTQVSGDVSVSNSGNNRGVISGVNSGEINM